MACIGKGISDAKLLQLATRNDFNERNKDEKVLKAFSLYFLLTFLINIYLN